MPNGEAVGSVVPVAINGKEDAAVAIARAFVLDVRLVGRVRVGGRARVQEEVGVKGQALREMGVYHRPYQ